MSSLAQDQYKKLMALLAHDTTVAYPSVDHSANLAGTILSCISSS